MTLKSGDRVFFDVTTSHMTLQFVSKANLERNGSCGPDGRPNVADTVVLTGADVSALLGELGRITHPRAVVEEGRPGTSRLYVRTEATRRGKTLFIGDCNEITMTQAERHMLSSAIKSRVWRLYQ